jgi:hypothetical protein
MNKNYLIKNKMGSFFQLTATILVILLGVFALSVQVTPAQAAGTVTDCTTYDGGPGSLKQALAGGGLVTFSCSGTIIVPEITINANTPTVIDATGYDVTLSGNNANRVFNVNSGKSLTLGNVTVADGKTIGYGGGVYVAGGSLTVENSTFTGNSADGNAGYGGAIYNSGTTLITNSVITGNSAEQQAGAISNHGSLSLINSTISGNTAQNQGGGLVGAENSTTVLTNSTVTANSTNGTGGGIQQFGVGVVTLSNTIVAGNSAAGSGPDLAGMITSNDYNLVGDTSGATFAPQANDIVGQDPLLGSLADNGGPTLTQALLQGSPAIDAGMTDLTVDQRGEARPFGLADDIGAFELQTCFVDSWSVANEVELNAAIACYNTKTTAGSHTITVTQDITLTANTIAINNATSGVSLVIAGDGFAVDGQGTSGVRPFEIAANTAVTMNELTVTGGNVVNAKGGGIFNDGTLTINDSEILENEAQGFQSNGGGIHNGGTLTVVRTIVSDNDANIWYGGGVHNAGNLAVIDSTISGNAADRGGGIYNNTSEPAALSNSTISGNRSSNDGGGIYNTSAVSMTVRNSTVSDNVASTNGGGIHNTSSDLTLDSVTITGNSASDGGALNNIGITAQTTVKNSILANSVSTSDCVNSGGTITDGGHNLVETQSACGFTDGVNGNIVGSDPVLGPLDDNGGPTETHALLNGSPAIDAGDTTLTTDQRGVTRPQFGVDDIGAYESLCGTATSWTAGTEFELDTAIGCFNKQTVAGSYTITVTANISLTSNIAAINNPTSGADLVIEGGDHIIDGGDAPGNPGAGGFRVDSPTAVTITDLTVTRCRVLLTGGAIRNVNGGALTLNNVSLTQNQAGFGGGALSSNGPVTISNSVISHNYNPAGAGGGGILIESPGSLTLKNSTISGNTSDVTGGGISVEGGSASMDSVTVADNSAPTGGGIAQTGGTVTLVNTIVGNNSASGSGPDLSGTITSNDYNLIEDVAGATFAPQAHDITGVDPLLDTLQDNGGPTETHALLAGSPALDTGSTLETTDQRGEARPFGLADDIGAFELQTCYVDSWSVGNEAELNAAIACYNTKTVAGSYTITLTQEILLTASTTAIYNAMAGVELTIEGSGFAVDGQDISDVRPFTIQANTTVTMNDLTATGGNVIGGGVDNRGGGILNQGNLTLNRSTVISNTAETFGGGLATRGGTVAINDSTIANNVSGTPSNLGFGGGLHNENGQVTIRNSTISGNYTDGINGLGGGIANLHNMTLESVTITENSATNGGGIYFSTTSPVTLTIKNTILAGNGTDDCYFETIAGGATINDLGYNLVQADNQLQPCGFVGGVNNNLVTVPFLLPLADNGGSTQTHALDLDSPAIDAGDTSLTTDQRGVARPQGAAADIGAFESTWCSDDAWSVSRQNQLDAAIDCFNGKTVAGTYTITITSGFPAVASTTPIDNSTPGVSLVIEGSGYLVDWNGDLFPGTRPFLISADTTVTINDLAIINGNVLGKKQGGGILNLGNLTLNRTRIRDNRAEYDGGGISNYGVMVINDSTVAGNIIEGGSAPVVGGGIHNEGSLTIRNSTISGNTSSNDGGGIGNVGTLDLDSVTVTANSAQGIVGGSAGAGVFIGASGTLTTRNSILAGNLDAEDCWAANPVTDGGHNLVETQINCGFVDGVNGSIVGESANLGPLQNNGGPTQTHALLSDSPAIEAGNTILTTDQRGQSRPAGAADDIGAFELQSVVAFTLTVTTDGTGSGIVTSTPPGINCGSDCSQSFTAGTVVTLTATPDPDSTFTGWSGACTNSTGNCIVTMDAAKSVMATFTKKDEHYNIYLPIIFN